MRYNRIINQLTGKKKCEVVNNFKRFFTITAIFTLYAAPLCGAQKSAEKQ